MSTGNEPDRWNEICRLFDEAVGLDGDVRRRFLEEIPIDLRGEVEGLLASYSGAGEVLGGPSTEVLDLPRPPAPEASAGRVGNYELLELLGRGGMGAVYLARRADDVYQKVVAVKILQRGLESSEGVARFRAERQILAGLEHPNIARLLDGGNTDDGRPFLVMERVEGVAIDRYADLERLTVGERLELFEKVAAAVQYAHQNLVVHRDLKPANILITAEGEPRLLDFGIAKIVGPDAGPGLTVDRAPLTPSYASPEQLAGERVTTASDVYSLGVVLYELLTGVRPFARPAETSAARTVIDDRLPARPSSAVATTTRPSAEGIAADRRTDKASLKKALQGDLDTILLKALHPEASRRYGSARELIEDLERHRTGQPVSARADTWGYRSAKFVRRHRVSLGLAGAALVVLIGFLVALLVQRGQILRQRNRAEKATEFMVELFSLPDPTRSRGATITVREVLDRGAAEVRRELSGAPDVRAALMLSMARSYLNLGSHTRAAPLAEEALEIDRRTGDALGEAAALDLLGEVATRGGDYERGRRLLGEARALRERHLGENAPETLETLSRLSNLEQLAGENAEAEAVARQAVERARRAGHDEPLSVALRRLARAISVQGAMAEAEQLLREALEVENRLHGSPHPESLGVANDLAVLLESMGKLTEANELLKSSVSEAEVLFRDEPHPYQAIALGNQARVVAALGDASRAEALGRESLALLRRIYGAEHPRVAAGLSSLGDLAWLRGDLGSAERLFREALAMYARLGEEGSQPAGLTENNLAAVLFRRGAYDEAERLYRSAVDHQRARLGNRNADLATTLTNLGELLIAQGDLDEAERILAEALPMARATLAPGSPRLTDPLRVSASLARTRGRLDEAAALYTEALATTERELGDESVEVAQARVNLGDLELRRSKPELAEPLLAAALPVLEKAAASPGDAWVLATRRLWGVALSDLGRHAEAEKQLLAVHEQLSAAAGPASTAAQQVAEVLAKLYERWQRPVEAARWRARTSGKPR